MRAIIAALLTSLFFAGAAHAQMGPGPAEPGTAIASYNPATGEIIISVNNVLKWYVESTTASLTGTEPPFGDISGVLVTNSDSRIGLQSFSLPFNDVNSNLGPVAAPGLPLSDLALRFSAGLGEPEVSGVILLLVPEPSTLSMAALVALVSRRRRTQWPSAR